MSEFEGSRPIEQSAGIDFTKARELKTTGTTCDAYETRHYRRHVFVKRLKEEFRTSPRHLAALQKEYEIVVNINHSGLPRYTEFHEDYIIMDFVDGETLADIIKRKEHRLNDPDFVKRILTELLNIVSYLHKHNIYHNDIKADNIMITFQSENVVLIDFDKCFTSWWDDTPGSSNLYGLSSEKTGSAEVDFRGLGEIARKLSGFVSEREHRNQIVNFAEICKKDGITTDDLIEILEKKSGNKYKIYMIAGGIITFLIVSGVGLWSSKNIDDKISKEIAEITTPAQTRIDTLYVVAENLYPGIESDQIEVTPIIVNESSNPSKENKKQPSETEITEILDRLYVPLIKLISETKEVSEDTDADKSDFVDKIMDLSLMQGDLTQNAYKILEERYPDLNPIDIQLEVVKTKRYRETSEEISRLSNLMVGLQSESTED